MDFSTDIMTILRRGGDPWSKMAPTGADTACAQAPACQTYLPIDEHTEILVNPSGQFVEGGQRADTGLTGWKLMVDTYGGLGSHGGGHVLRQRPIQGRPVSGLHGSPDRSYDR